MKLIFPQSIERYNRNLLEKVSNINPKSIMFSRELAYRTILDLKQRNPLAFLPLDTDEKQEVLSNLIELSSKIKNAKDQEWFKGLASELSNTWSHMYEFLSDRGAMGTFNIGLGPIINTTVKNFTGKDYFIEIMDASQSIEWAAANQAVLCPVGPLAKNEENIAYLYSGVRRDWGLNLVTSPNIATEGILTIANYVPVLELAETFTGKEIDQFRKLLIDLTYNKSSDEINSIVEEFNKTVKAYEKKRKRIDTWDVKGITLDTALELTNSAIPFSGFIAKQVGRLIDYSGDKNESVRKAIQQVQSKISSTSPNVILVSRMRDKVKDLL
ncbi:hypothetical protein [Virgibacillus oceani]|uniref:Uncharacterized protein n=1 Tax=Virgibacillus oceani TaxID=1479511 RepID=A0A917LVQ2_9BACI|nr:hypothetical protein [Virgibacillus oceani]GGG61436.1 hypothetical protein GCM10011398_00910 [Virgibacillus oceani]